MPGLENSQLGRYDVQAAIGSGGFGDVYRGYDPLLQRDVALKVLKTNEALVDAGSLGLSLKEARAASALNHPGIITVYDVGEQNTDAYIVTEWIAGATLRDELCGEPLPSSRISHIASQVAAALARAHEEGIVHRDLKPENIMIRTDGVAKILDFGLARRKRVLMTRTGTETPHMAQADSMSASSSTIAGTPGYMAPEQIAGSAAAAATDLFALGVILYEMCTGSHPFRGDTTDETLARTLHADPSPPGTIVELPAGWNDLLVRLLSKEADMRPQSAAEVLHFMGGVVAHPSVRHRAQHPAPVRMVGRSSDLHALTDRWAAANEGHGGFVLVSGEPGIGKSTLVESFSGTLKATTGILTATGQCSERLGAGEAYRPFLDALSQLTSTPHGGLIRSIVRGKAPTWYVQLFPEARSEEVGREVLGGGQERMQREFVDVLEELSRTFSLCIVIEDVHWTDEASAELLAYLSKRIGALPVLVVVTLRPSELKTESRALDQILQDMQARSLAARLELQLLSREQVHEYVDTTCPENDFPSDFTGWVYDKSEGNPLFMTDLLRYLRENDVIADEAGWHLIRPLEDIEGEIPASGRAFIGRIIERLPRDQQELLAFAAVSGRVFDSLVLTDVSEVGAEQIEQALDQLVEVHGLLDPLEEREFPDGELSLRYQFAHVLYQNFLYEKLTPTRRRRLHLETGEAIEKHLREEATRHASELALHFDLGRVPARAIPYYVSAAQTEMLKFAVAQSEAFCERALSCVDKLPEEARMAPRLQVLQLRSQLRSGVSRFEEAIADAEAMERIGQEAGYVEASAAALGLKVLPLFQLQREKQLEETAEQAIDLGVRQNVPPATAIGQLARGLLHWSNGRLDESDKWVKLSRQKAEELRLGGIAAQGGVLLGSAHFFRGRYQRALPLLQEARALFGQSLDPHVLLVTWFFEGMTHANMGHLALARDALTEGLKLAKTNGERFSQARFPDVFVWLALETFDHARALKLGREARDIARSMGFLEPEANSEIDTGLAAMMLGDLAQARECFLRADDLFGRDGYLRWRYRQRLDLGWSTYHLRMENPDQARDYACACIERAKQTSRGKHLVLAHRQLALIALSEGKLAEAQLSLCSADTELQATDSVLAAWRVHCTWADYYRAADADDHARVHEQQAGEILTRVAHGAPAEDRERILKYVGGRLHREAV